MIGRWRDVMCVLVRKLLQAGTSPDASNDDGLTALHQVRSTRVFFTSFTWDCIDLINESVLCRRQHFRYLPVSGVCNLETLSHDTLIAKKENSYQV